jgi:hypothetical protein
MSITFPFDDYEVLTWLLLAREDCIDEDFQNQLGGRIVQKIVDII